ncbi:ArnT family glycosyltransferase [Flavisolibacter nicotianae]|uniref:ArnT family glycosyltransferase n=1 Tax=Flavisolibacter nicotianae TaxID=2364882 RepID=UPI000EB3DE9A|nr:glycosyltransferase family 39 protein [Flavisolibacter nicotianae]
MRRLPAELIIVVGALLLFVPFLGTTHLFDWDEINFAEASREMLVTKNYAIPQIGFEPFWEKPPLFFWLQVICMKIFGVNDFAARLPNAACGILTLVLLYRLGKKLVNEQFGRIWALIYAGSLLPQLYFKSGIIDPWFNLFIFLAVYQLAAYTDNRTDRPLKRILLAGLFTGLAVMTKGPVALLITGLCYGVFAISTRFRKFMKPLHILLFLLVAALAGGIWFIALLANGQQHIITEFIVYQIRLFRTEDAGHGGPFFYHFIILLLGCFPAAALSILSMRIRKRPDETPRHFRLWMSLLFWVTLLLFSIVKTKIVHYSSLCYFPLTYLAAISFYHLYRRKWDLPSWNKWLQAGTGLLLSLLILGVTFIDQLKPFLLQPGRIKDPFARANLAAQVSWTGWEKLPGVLLLGGVLFFVLRANRNIRSALTGLFLASLLAINLTIVLITPKVEPYSQGAAIEFYQSKKGEAAIVEPLRFKSYAHLFYTQRPPQFTRSLADSIRQFNTHPEIPVYYVGKIQNREENEREMPYLQKLYEKNGFVFYRRISTP